MNKHAILSNREIEPCYFSMVKSLQNLFTGSIRFLFNLRTPLLLSESLRLIQCAITRIRLPTNFTSPANQKFVLIKHIFIDNLQNSKFIEPLDINTLLTYEKSCFLGGQ